MDTSGRSGDQSPVSSQFDPDLLKKAITVDLLEMHQQLKSYADKHGEDAVMELFNTSVDEDSTGDLFNYQPIPSTGLSSVFIIDEEDEEGEEEDGESSSISDSRPISNVFEDEASSSNPFLPTFPTNHSKSGTPINTTTFDFFGANSLSLPTSPVPRCGSPGSVSSMAIRSSNTPPPIYSVSKVSSGASLTTTPSQPPPPRPSQREPKEPRKGGNIFMMYAKRIGEAYGND